jgi:hypothetical protein
MESCVTSYIADGSDTVEPLNLRNMQQNIVESDGSDGVVPSDDSTSSSSSSSSDSDTSLKNLKTRQRFVLVLVSSEESKSSDSDAPLKGLKTKQNVDGNDGAKGLDSDDMSKKQLKTRLLGDSYNIALLLLLYLLQGIPLGISGSIPYILQDRQIKYKVNYG